jgi:hypothetical protein
MSTEFEIWDSKTRNVLQFERLGHAIHALQGLVRNGGPEVLVGLSLDAVSDDGDERLTLAEDEALLELVGATTEG